MSALFRTGMMARRTTTRAPVNWARLIFRYTDARMRESLVSLQSKFSEISTAHASVPKQTEEINWAEWKKKIRTPGVVDQFKAEYDQQMKKEVKLNEGEAAAKKSAQEAEIRALEQKAAVSGDFLKDVKDELDWTTQWYNHPEQVVQGSWKSWNKYKRDHMYPHYKIYWVNQRMFLSQSLRKNGHTSAGMKNVDLVEMRNQLNTGNARALLALAPVDAQNGDISSLQRPFNKKWMKPINYDELAKNPTGSLAYRAFALKQIL